MSVGTMLFNPFTGMPRHPDDIKSDPRGVLVWDGDEPLKAAAPTHRVNHLTAEREKALDEALAKVRAEVLRAITKFPPFNSAHEGFAVLREEVDELWDDVKRDHPAGALDEAVQVAAMGVRFMMDVRAKR